MNVITSKLPCVNNLAVPTESKECDEDGWREPHWDGEGSLGSIEILYMNAAW